MNWASAGDPQIEWVATTGDYYPIFTNTWIQTSYPPIYFNDIKFIVTEIPKEETKKKRYRFLRPLKEGDQEA
jgi:hypothetical protein